MTVEIIAKMNDRHPTTNKNVNIGAGSTQIANAPRSSALRFSTATVHRATTKAIGASSDVQSSTLVLVFSIRQQRTKAFQACFFGPLKADC
jgi:hypothetical protein